MDYGWRACYKMQLTNIIELIKGKFNLSKCRFFNKTLIFSAFKDKEKNVNSFIQFIKKGCSYNIF